MIFSVFFFINLAVSFFNPSHFKSSFIKSDKPVVDIYAFILIRRTDCLFTKSIISINDSSKRSITKTTTTKGPVTLVSVIQSELAIAGRLETNLNKKPLKKVPTCAPFSELEPVKRYSSSAPL